MKLSNLFLILASLFAFSAGHAQSEGTAADKKDKPVSKPVYETFMTTRIINAHSVETVKKYYLDFRVTHRFGDAAGVAGGISQLYGLDNVTDVRIAFEYGLTDDITLSASRSKGYHRRQLWEGQAKYRLMTQTTDNRRPFSIAVMANWVITSMPASSDSTSENSFNFNTTSTLTKLGHRSSNAYQLMIARKFGDRLSLQLMPTYVHRGYVAFDDVNGLFAVGAGARLKLNKIYALIGEYFYVYQGTRTPPTNVTYYDPLSLGLEIKTGGHVFHLNFSNSRGILENEFIPYTTANWLSGEFRFGFNISRPYKLF